MSTVRMCDYEGCGIIFSERERGWSTGHITVVGENGARTEQADFCPDHTAARVAGVMPRVKGVLPPARVQATDTEAEQWFDGKEDALPRT